MVIGGWTSEGKRLRSLLAGVHKGQGKSSKLVYVGRVGTGFSEATVRKLLPRLCAPLIVAPALAAELRRLGDEPLARSLRGWLRAASSAGLARGALAAAMAIAIGVGVWRLPGIVIPNTYVPAAAVEAVKRAGITGRVFNGYDVGGYLMFLGIAPFIDGRLDMYGEPLLRRFNALADMPKLLADFDIGWTLFHPADPHVAELDRLAGWRRFHADDVAVVHVRTEAPQKR